MLVLLTKATNLFDSLWAKQCVAQAANPKHDSPTALQTSAFPNQVMVNDGRRLLGGSIVSATRGFFAQL